MSNFWTARGGGPSGKARITSSRGVNRRNLILEFLEDRQLLAEVVTIATPTPVQVSNAQQVMQFQLNRTADTDYPLDSLPQLTLTYSTVNGTAQAGTDFVGQTNQTVTFAAGSSTADVDVTILPQASSGWAGQNSRSFSLDVTASQTTPLFSSVYQPPGQGSSGTVDIATGDFGGSFPGVVVANSGVSSGDIFEGISQSPRSSALRPRSRWTASPRSWRWPTS